MSNTESIYLQSGGKIRLEIKPEASLWKNSNTPLCKIVSRDSVLINYWSKWKFSLARKRPSDAAYIIINILYVSLEKELPPEALNLVTTSVFPIVIHFLLAFFA